MVKNTITTDNKLIAAKLTEKLAMPIHYHEILQVLFNTHSLFLSLNCGEKVFKAILNLKNESGGCDAIQANKLKLAAPYISNFLAITFINAISQGQWLQQLKTAEVSPIYKDEKKFVLLTIDPYH